MRLAANYSSEINVDTARQQCRENTSVVRVVIKTREFSPWPKDSPGLPDPITATLDMTAQEAEWLADELLGYARIVNTRNQDHYQHNWASQ